MSLRSSAAYIGVRIASGALAMITLALIVRHLGPERYGQLTLGLAAAAAVTLVLFNPLNASIARFHAEAAWQGRLLRVLRNSLVGIGLALIVLAAALEWLGLSWLAPGVLLAAACMALAQGMFDFSGQHLAATQRSRAYALQFLGKALLSLLFCSFVVFHDGGAERVLIAMAAAFALPALGVGQAWRRLPPVPLQGRVSLAPVHAFSGPLLLTSFLAYSLLWGDRYVLERLVPLAELGHYSAIGDLIQQTLALIFSGLSTAWYARLVLAWSAGDAAETQRLYSRYAALMLAIGLPAGLGLALVLPQLLPLLYGDGYADLPWQLPALICAAATLAGVKTYFFDQALLLARRVWWHAASIMVAAVCGLVLAVVLVPIHGVAGAAAGLLAGHLAGVLVSLRGARGVLVAGLAASLAWPPVLGAVLMSAALLVFTPSGWSGLAARVLVGALVYAATLWLADFDGLRQRWARRRAARGAGA